MHIDYNKVYACFGVENFKNTCRSQKLHNFSVQVGVVDRPLAKQNIYTAYVFHVSYFYLAGWTNKIKKGLTWLSTRNKPNHLICHCGLEHLPNQFIIYIHCLLSFNYCFSKVNMLTLVIYFYKGKEILT